ncbi:hypothetical protein HPB52_000715 [Rhipicephalus sanguineus]|uniref:Uncharacterized protein n=1 Tax=Rhipicephalus sanguineus TaxID=34632 RepID=A0A9D4QJ01_RHISA|nr:hypothetical protein HPB52_000715 [Rhipicephalus sanguineus]
MAAFFSIVSLRGGFVRFEGADEDEGAVGAIAVNGESARRKAQHETARNSVDAEGYGSRGAVRRCCWPHLRCEYGGFEDMKTTKMAASVVTLGRRCSTAAPCRGCRNLETARVNPLPAAHDDELPSADVAFDDLRAGGVLILAEITLEGFADADKDLELCAELTDDEIIHQVTEDSDDSDTENEEPAHQRAQS